MDRRHAIYEWFRTNRFTVDLTAAIILVLLFGPVYLLAGRPFLFLLSCCLLLPLAWRRTRPEVAAGVVVLVCLVQWAAGAEPVAGQIAVPLVIYATAAYGPAWASRAVLLLGLLGGVMLTTREYSGSAASGILGLTIGALYTVLIWMLVLVSWTLGDLTRVRRLQLQALEDRTRRLEIEHNQERQLAAADERSHIAREMHDIVAHSLSVIITQADGARYAAAAKPELATEALATIAATGRDSLAEMRRLLGVLRSDDGSPTRPQPRLSDLDELLLGFRAAGLQVSFEQHGTPRRQLPAGAELTAYRTIQEALTNVIKHAGPSATAALVLTWQNRGLEIDIRDDGRGAAADPPVPGGGNGLPGMGERIALYDGSLSAGPQQGGGFRVSVLIPYSEA
ncbi:two-component sensor histidine kinase [Paenarthrobacter ureafaciens]|uniref:histidine kinase n=1 Tax=Paenarthrobacter ureafaciens TaxID=37931 RepID=A0AAX3EDQ9_PAEUR|nr:MULTISPECIES: histidine kinase [Paenarthrobacter]NKR13193.1 two-component sensor histidine kinase [Arthrobacter sp. M5]NKR14957.1 two-component sensor histidine kinase [Arthrobacter sp. M6]OEH62501.1 two-component sensor histidine kinase [Arthrobacter sp. D4]OEH63072.1 two-component sensor histidine kinase [Arthrobacter sp. D2]BCW84741.1 two-component sensor histidine kinase [Arthrobacter sp. NicSoilE8]